MGDAIRIEGLQKHYPHHPLFQDFSLSVDKGSVIGLLGPNGAGKTTLIKLITGLMTPDAGRIRLFEELIPGSSKASRQIGYMPQQIALYGGLTVWENLLFFGRLYGLVGDALESRCTETLQRVRLTKERDTPVHSLSGGMARRALLATAVVHRPKLLLLDEPTAGVDPMLRREFWNWLEGMTAEGTTILVTTHHIAEASRCKEVLFLLGGKVLERGTPQALMERYHEADLEKSFLRAMQAQDANGADT